MSAVDAASRPRSSQAVRVAKALPAIVRIAFIEAVAYRAEIIVWFLNYTMPLIMMALWTAVAREAPVGRFGEKEFCAYFLAMLVVRLLTGSWVVWHLNFEVRTGVLAQRMLKPFPPLLSYACENLGAIPLRIALLVPIAGIGLAWLGRGALTHDPVQLALAPLTVALAWGMTFLVMAIIGTLALWWESSLSVFDVWLGAYVVLSGYVMPLELFPERVLAVLDWLPFRYMLSLPVETLLGLCDRGQTLSGLAVQAGWLVVLFAACAFAWRAGVRRFSAYGG